MKRSFEEPRHRFSRFSARQSSSRAASSRLAAGSVVFLVLLFGFLRGQSLAEIIFTFEVPAANQTVSGIGPISGWAFSTTGARVTVSFRVDDQNFSAIPCCGDRPDVVQQHGPQALTSGFGQIFNFNRLAEGEHTIELKVQDGSSPERTETRKITVVKPGGFEVLSRLDPVFSNAEIRDNEEIVIEEASAVEKGTNNTQEVTIRLAWQENTQTLGIIRSENTTPSALLSQSAPAQRQATTQAAEGEGATELQLVFENPPTDETASGVGIISGWTFSPNQAATDPPMTVEFSIDGGAFRRIPCCHERPDVAAAFPSQEQALRSGFGALFNFNELTSDEHTIEIRVKDKTDATKSATHTITVVKPGDFAVLDQFDLSDAEAFIQGFSLVLDKVKVRDKATQQVREVTTNYLWRESCQCFVVQGACGNGSVEPGEECDGASLDNQTCQSLGFSGGTLTCTEGCILDMTGCEGGPRLLVTNIISDTVSVVNTATNEVKTTIRVGEEPRSIAVNPVSPTAYVANFRDDTISVIDTATETVTDTIQLSDNAGPQGITVSPNGAKVYVVNGEANSVSVIDALTKSVLASIPVGAQPQDIALTPDGTRAYVTNFGSDSVSVIDTQTNTVVATIEVGRGPDGIAVSPKNGANRAYVAHHREDSAFAIDTSTNSKIGDALTLNFQPTKVAFAPDGERAYIANFLAAIVSVIDPSTNQVLSGFQVVEEPDGVVVTPNNKRIYVALLGNQGFGEFVQVVSTVTNGIAGPFIQVGQGPFALAIAP